MPARKLGLQPYPREERGYLAKSDLFPKLDPPLSLDVIQVSIKKAFERAKKKKQGEDFELLETPQKLVSECLKHLKQRNDPIIGYSFYSKLNAAEVFTMDAIPHEMQRYRMRIGLFYQYLLIELMHKASQSHNTQIIRAFDGNREGDVQADVKTPNYDKGLRLYLSVKKSSDTVGGQDIGGAIKRLEDVVKQDKNLTSPYLCVFAIATPIKGKIIGYEESRQIRYNKDHHPYSPNCETWLPGFIYPYITGWSARDIYKEAGRIIDNYFPFYSLSHRIQCSNMLKNELIKLGISNEDGKIIGKAFFDYISTEI